ncbi:hypothetical protein OKA04_20860 [Luteolibacter flavescens]|uniref:Uncharacterized protein n=1 Tax=Luteolibacter flavescens TaxID=1859460 RepID=A0ABT3FUE3_9BACT|nr:hypothetical protein [Luteolibacter flavescens]MCW1887202.1 hypothetical protein [Luteolibacter flavescens]
MDENPYAPPAETSPPPDLYNPFNSAYYFRDGDFLVVRDGAELPPTCMRTNAPADAGSWRKRVTLAWTPPWVFFLLLINLIVLIVVMLFVQKRAKITYTLSAPVRRAIVWKQSVGGVLLVASVALIILFFAAEDGPDPVFGLTGIVSLIVSLILFIIANPIKVVKFRDDWFRVKGCSPAFLAGLPVHVSPF